MSLKKLMEEVKLYIESEVKEYQFKEDLINDTVVWFSVRPIKNWNKDNVINFIKLRYNNLKYYATSVCKQKEIVQSSEDYIPTIEAYINKYKKD